LQDEFIINIFLERSANLSTTIRMQFDRPWTYKYQVIVLVAAYQKAVYRGL